MVNLALPTTKLERDSRDMMATHYVTGVLLSGRWLSTAVPAAFPNRGTKPARAASIQTAAIPIPRPNPRRQKRGTADARRGQRHRLQRAWPAGQRRAEALASCRRLLGGPRSRSMSRWPPIGSDGGCGTAAPIELSSVAGIALTPPATVNCDRGQGAA